MMFVLLAWIAIGAQDASAVAVSAADGEFCVLSAAREAAHDAEVFDTPALPTLPQGELCGCMGFTHFSQTTRLQRFSVEEMLSSIKAITLRMARLCPSAASFPSKGESSSPFLACQPVNQYYVFTLRHILI